MSEIRFEIEGKEYVVTPIDSKITAEGQKVYARAFRKAVEDGALLKKRLDDYMRDQGIWDDRKEQEYHDYIKNIANMEYLLKSGKKKDGQKLKISEARQISIELKQMRNDFREFLTDRNYLDAITAEGQADQERFHFFVTKCVKDFLTQKPVFESVEDYKSRYAEPLTVELVSKFASYYYGVDDNYEDTLVENKFLKRFNLMDDKGYLLNVDGKRVDIDNNLLDEDGYRIDKDGNRIDINNNPIVDLDVEEAEFEDDFFQAS